MTDKTLHSLKNQLGIIIGFSELLLAEAPPGDQRSNDLQEIHKAAKTALTLVADLDGGRETPR